MYNLRQIRQRKSLGRYVNKRMKESLITGVPEIASCETSSRRSVKSLMFILCTVGFSYQTYSFIESFLKYETVQNMRIEYPIKFMAPAITFCNKNRINRERFCTALTEECLWYENKYGLCATVPDLCIGLTNYDIKVYGLPRNISHKYNLSNEFLDDYGPQAPWEYIRYTRSNYCRLEINGGIENCKDNDSILIQASNDGLPYKCFTIYSLLDKPNEEPRKLRPNDGYFFSLNTHPGHLWDSKDNLHFYMYVHDPRRLANPMAEGIALKPGYRYTISFTMQQTQTLPPPYDTNCEDYLSKWKENGGSGPITKKDCIELCKIERMMEQHSCVGKSITYPNRFPICSKISTISDKVVEECSSVCREACDVILYTIAAENHIPVMDGKHLAKRKHLQVAIKFRQLNLEKIFMEPKFQDIELFSYIGGFMGLWLGVSFVTFVDFLETMTDVITFAVMKWKKLHGKKRTRHRFPY